MDALKDVLEFAALAVIAVIAFSPLERSLAANAQAQASAQQQDAAIGLWYQAGSGILGNLSL